MVENTKYTRFDLNNNCRQTHTLFRQDPTLKEMAQNEQSAHCEEKNTNVHNQAALLEKCVLCKRRNTFIIIHRHNFIQIWIFKITF